jgi:hypothetical protein
MTAEFNAEHFTRELCQKLNLEVCDTFRANSFDFKEGWKSIVERMLKAMRGCNVQIFSVRNDYGMLDVRMVAEPASELTVYRAILVYQQLASVTCEICSTRGRKMVLGGNVWVLCPSCVNEAKEK